jgi:hypothetical protein
MTHPIPPEILRELLRCDAENGLLYWAERRVEFFNATQSRSADHACAIWNNRFAGRQAFFARNKGGYHVGKILGRQYQAHRVIWALHHGCWPAQEIDHINRCASDNRIVNLREASHSQNMANRRMRVKQWSSGYTGVYWRESGRKWRAQIGINGRLKCLGHFECKFDAARAYDNAAREHYGDFATLNIQPGASLVTGKPIVQVR